MTDENPEATVAKWMAYRQAHYRVKKLAFFTTWVIAVPIAAVFVHLGLVDWFLSLFPIQGELQPGGYELLWWMGTVATWSLIMLLLTPFRWYLNARWAVDPARFGFGEAASKSDAERMSHE